METGDFSTGIMDKIKEKMYRLRGKDYLPGMGSVDESIYAANMDQNIRSESYPIDIQGLLREALSPVEVISSDSDFGPINDSKAKPSKAAKLFENIDRSTYFDHSYSAVRIGYIDEDIHFKIGVSSSYRGMCEWTSTLDFSECDSIYEGVLARGVDRENAEERLSEYGIDRDRDGWSLEIEKVDNFVEPVETHSLNYGELIEVLNEEKGEIKTLEYAGKGSITDLSDEIDELAGAPEEIRVEVYEGEDGLRYDIFLEDTSLEDTYISVSSDEKIFSNNQRNRLAELEK